MGLDKVFYYLRKRNDISRSMLYKYGVDDDTITELVHSNVLLSNDDENFVIGDIYDLFMYGRYQLELKNYNIANSIFICCYMKDPIDFLTNYQLFYRSLIQKNEKNVFKHFNVVYNALKHSDRKSDANYYLYLLGNIYGVPDKYREEFNDLEEDDILLPPVDGVSMYENLFRRDIYNNSYYKVNARFDEKFDSSNKDSMTFEDMLEKELILKWLVKNRNFNKMLILYINDNRVDEVKSLLDKEDENRFLTKTNQYLLKVVNMYQTIRDTGVIPTIKYNGDDVFEAIDGNNFDLAMQLIKKYQKTYNIEKDSYLYLMLEKIVGLIKMVEANNNLEKNKSEINLAPLIEAVEEMRKNDVKSLTDKERKMLDDKIRELHNGRSVCLLEPMTKEKRNLVHEYISSYDDIVAFSIGEGDLKQLVLRYKPYVKEYVSVADVAYRAKRNYDKHNYEAAANDYELLLKIGKPRDNTYGRYGMTLLKLHKKREALDCLKIATILSKEHNGNLDYTDLIEKLEYPVDPENKKTKVVVLEEEFNDDNKKDLDKDLINDIIGLSQEGDISLIDACNKLNLSLEDINYVKLLYARDCYYLGKIAEGDIYLKQVEKSKNKDKRVKDLFKEIQTNKKYYQSRLDEDKKQLVFIKK